MKTKKKQENPERPYYIAAQYQNAQDWAYARPIYFYEITFGTFTKHQAIGAPQAFRTKELAAAWWQRHKDKVDLRYTKGLDMTTICTCKHTDGQIEVIERLNNN